MTWRFANDVSVNGYVGARDAELLQLTALHYGRKPWAWASLPGLPPRDRESPWVYARSKASGHWSVRRDDLPLTCWLVSERK